MVKRLPPPTTFLVPAAVGFELEGQAHLQHRALIGIEASEARIHGLVALVGHGAFAVDARLGTGVGNRVDAEVVQILIAVGVAGDFGFETFVGQATHVLTDFSLIPGRTTQQVA